LASPPRLGSHRAKYLELNYQLAIDILTAHRRWIEATKQALDPGT
jgi:hypothetical protein